MTSSQRVPPIRVVVASEHALMAEAVRAALQGRGFEAAAAPWPGIASRRGAEPTGPIAPAGDPDVGLLISELDTSTKRRAARVVVRKVVTRWMTMTGAPEGPAWGAVLEAGVLLVVPSSLSLDRIETDLRAFAGGRLTIDRALCVSLVEEWTRQRRVHTEVAARLATLTARERQVLQLLDEGLGVAAIAVALEVAPATVRSQVKAVLHKLRVSSQLAAVSLLRALDADDGAS